MIIYNECFIHYTIKAKRYGIIARLQGADLRSAYLQGHSDHYNECSIHYTIKAKRYGIIARLQGADLRSAYLQGHSDHYNECSIHYTILMEIKQLFSCFCVYHAVYPSFSSCLSLHRRASGTPLGPRTAATPSSLISERGISSAANLCISFSFITFLM